MKKILNQVCLLLRQHRKKLIVMRNTVLILLISALQVFATGSYAQTKKISLAMNDATIREVLYAIQNQSEFYFLYNSELIDVAKKVDITIEEEKVDAILTRLFDKNEVDFLIKDRYIVLTPVGGNAELFAEQQQPAVSGTVTDESGEPLPGVTVVVKGTTQGTVTNANGEYSLSNIPESAALVFSFVGMQTQEIVVDNRTNIDVEMQVDAIGIEEVVAIGYGTQKRVNLTGSVATVDSKNLTTAPTSNVTKSLAGRLPGLVSKQENGMPGTTAGINIRGFGSALVIVDGVESSFSNIDPNEIETISILKDASAAIYGSRAGNGVILITTKRGNISKPLITFSSSYTAVGYTRIMTPSSSGQYTEMEREAWINSGKDPNTAPYSQEAVDLYYAGTDPDYPNADWVDFIIRPFAPMNQHNLSIRGGSDKIKYYGFLGYLDQETHFRKGGGDYRRFNFRSNIDATILDNLILHLNVSNILGLQRFPWRTLFGGGDSAWQDLYNARPMFSTSLPDKTRIPYSGSTAVAGITNRDIAGYDNTDNQSFQGSMALDYSLKAIDGLKFKVFFNYAQNGSYRKYFEIPFTAWSYNYAADQYIAGSTIANNSLSQWNSRSRMLNGQFSVNYEKIFAEVHELNLLGLYEITDYYGDNLSATRQGFLSSKIDYLFGGSESSQLNNGSAWEMGRASYVGRLNYSYKSKYLLETTLRYDASAKFSPDTRWGLFPSISMGWRISEEGFVKNSLQHLDNLKLRLSYSQTGRDDIGNFQYLAGYRFGRGYAIGNNIQKGITDRGLPNYALTWEEMTLYNIGTDFSLWKRKLYGEFDVFYRTREGMLANRLASLPNTFGASLPPENINSSNDRGFESLIGTEGRTNDFTWNISANISWSRAKWDHYEEPEYTDPDDIRIKKRSGKWLDIAYGYLSDGLFTSQDEIDNLGYDQDQKGNSSLRPGDIRYKDLNLDGKIDWRDQTEIGKGTFPHWMFGFNSTLTYRNFDFSMLVQGATGYNNFVRLSATNVEYYNQRWTAENNNPNAFVPRLGGSTTNNWQSDHQLKNVFYARFKTVSLGYSVPDSLLKKLNAEGLRIYFAGTNLFTFSSLNKYGIDPESPSGVFSYYPQERTFSIGLNLSL
jgi:TonB-linked SusC/RagA family outer membrane protein